MAMDQVVAETAAGDGASRARPMEATDDNAGLVNVWVGRSVSFAEEIASASFATKTCSKRACVSPAEQPNARIKSPSG
jgi:hypothetical protein